MTTITLEAITRHAAGQQVQWIRNGGIAKTETIPDAGKVAIAVDARPGEWFTAILRDCQAMDISEKNRITRGKSASICGFSPFRHHAWIRSPQIQGPLYIEVP